MQVTEKILKFFFSFDKSKSLNKLPEDLIYELPLDKDFNVIVNDFINKIDSVNGDAEFHNAIDEIGSIFEKFVASKNLKN